MVQVDDNSSGASDAESKDLTPQTLLYRYTGLGPGPHEVRVANTPFRGQALGINYAVARFVHRHARASLTPLFDSTT